MKKKQRDNDFLDVPTLPDGRYRAAWQRWEYRGADKWELVRDGAVLGEVARMGGAWTATRAGDTAKVGFLTFGNACEHVEDACG